MYIYLDKSSSGGGGVAVDSKDNVYVSDQTLPRVQKFDSDGNFIKMWGEEGNDKGEFVHQHDITVDSKDYVYVTDGREKSRVSVFDSDGNYKIYITLLYEVYIIVI